MTPPLFTEMRDEAGFSLTELLVASLLMIIITTALFSSLEQTEVLYEDYSADMDLRQQARVAMTQITDEMRMIGYDLGNLDESISIANDTQVQFVGDMDAGDEAGACDADAENADNGGAERVTYSFDAEGGTLRRVVDCWNGTAWTNGVQDSIVLSGLDPAQFLFRFFDSTGTRIPLGGGPLDEAGRADVRSIALEFGLSDEWVEDLIGDDRTDLTLSQHVKLPNRTYGEE